MFALLCVGSNAHAEPNGVAVLELFTTQVCPDCVPADEILRIIVAEGDENIIALGCHVTYLDRDDVRDKLSKEFCDKRHAAYYKSMSLSSIYTPQLIINGRFDTYGDDEKTVRAGAGMVIAAKDAAALFLGYDGDHIDITLPKMRFDTPVDVWIFGYDKMRRENINVEEYIGNFTDHANSVQYLEKIMVWDGAYQNISYPITNIPADGYAVVVQTADDIGIVAAGKVEVLK